MKSFKFTKEGLPIGSNFPHDSDDKRGAAILSVSERYVKEYTLGNLKRILIETGNDTIVLSKTGENGVLSILKRDYSLLTLIDKF